MATNLIFVFSVLFYLSKCLTCLYLTVFLLAQILYVDLVFLINKNCFFRRKFGEFKVYMT